MATFITSVDLQKALKPLQDALAKAQADIAAIKVGAQGPQGAAGAQGAAGPQGPQGAAGNQPPATPPSDPPTTPPATEPPPVVQPPTTGIVIGFAGASVRLAAIETTLDSTIYRAAIDDHLVAFAEVRSGARMVWLEASCDLYKPNPARRDGLATVTIDGAVVFSQAVSILHHTRAVLVNPPAVAKAGFDWRTLIDSKRAPPYGFRSPTAVPALLPYKVPSGDPTGGPFGGPKEGGLGSLPYDMGDPGFAWYIGLLPLPDALYATSGKALDMVLDCAMAGGSYSVHYRDEATGKPFLPSKWPNVWLQDATGDANQAPTPGDGINARADVAHMPAFGFVAYLATGWRFFLEEAQFWALYAFGWPSYAERQGASGTLTQQPRGQAWTLRQWAQAAAITPDSDPLKADLLKLIEGGLAQKRAMCVDGTIASGVFSHYHNALGVLGHYNGSGIAGDPYGGRTPGQGWQDSLFMHNFFVQALGYVSELGLPLSAKGQADLIAVRDFAYRHAVAQGWSPKHVGVYTRPYGLIGDPPNVYPQPYFTDYAAAWQQVQFKVATFDASPAAPLVNYDGTEVVGGIPNSYVANHVPGLAYAVRHNAPGAQGAWDFLVQSSTWKRDAGLFNDTPIFGITPTGAPPVVVTPVPDPIPFPDPKPLPTPDPTGTPAWLSGKPALTMFQIPGTELSRVDPAPQRTGVVGPAAKVMAWCGAALRKRGSVLVIGPAGGHNDYAGNERDALRLSDDAPAWVEIGAATPNDKIVDAAYFLDGQPNPGHNYYSAQYLDGRDCLAIVGQSTTWPAGGSYPNFNAFDYQTRKWLRFADCTFGGTEAGVVKHDSTEDLYIVRGASGIRWINAEDRWVPWLHADNDIDGAPWAYDSKRNEFARMGNAGNGWFLVLPAAATDVKQARLGSNPGVNGLARRDFLAPNNGAGAGMVYVPTIDRYVYSFRGRSFWTIHPDTQAVEQLSIAGTMPADGNVYNRLQYCPELDGCVFVSATWGVPAYFFRF